MQQTIYALKYMFISVGRFVRTDLLHYVSAFVHTGLHKQVSGYVLFYVPVYSFTYLSIAVRTLLPA